MRHDKKDIGMFSDEDPNKPKKRKRKIKVSESQYQRLFKEKEISEQDDMGDDTGSDSGDSSSSGGGEVWSSGASSYDSIARNHSPVGNGVWNSGVDRSGPANNWV